MSVRGDFLDIAVEQPKKGFIRRHLLKAMEDINSSYDETERRFVNQAVRLLYSKDGIGATSLEDRVLRTVKVTSGMLSDEFCLDPTDPEFGREFKWRKHSSSGIRNLLKRDTQIHLMLVAEFFHIVSDQNLLKVDVIRTGRSKRPFPATSTESYLLQGNCATFVRIVFQFLIRGQVLKGVRMMLNGICV